MDGRRPGLFVRLAASAFVLALAACSHPAKKVIVIGVDGMDPGFVEQHWSELPNLRRLRDQGSFSRLRTTTPPQSPVAWSTFVTGLDPGEHGIFDFVHRDPATHTIFLSTDRTIASRFTLALGPYEIPLLGGRVESLRRGTAFWQVLADRGIPVTVVRMPTNYPPLHAGRAVAGMGTPDLGGTQGTFTFYTTERTSENVPGGRVRQVQLSNHHVELTLEGPPNSLRRDGAPTKATLMVDVDPEHPVMRVQAGNEFAVVQQGEWSDWIPVDFPLIRHVVAVRGMFRVYAKQLRPGFEVYVSPVNVDPYRQALPVTYPASFGADFGRYYTVGIPEDTAAVRQGVFRLTDFLEQTRLVLRDEQQMLTRVLDGFRDGFLFFYFSSVDQNSHILWGRHDRELLRIYRAVDRSIGEVLDRERDATVLVMSDHGFSTFARAVNLNTWLLEQGLLVRSGSNGFDWSASKAYAIGLNALYLNGADLGDVRQRLLEWRDTETGRAVVTSVEEIRPAAANRGIAPNLVVGYAPGYRASWATGVGEVPETEIEDNRDAWIADHCINAADVPGVLFASRGVQAPDPSLKGLSSVILGLFQ